MIGPAVVGVIADMTGNIRYGFVFLALMLAIPIPVLVRVCPDRGADEARAWVGKGAALLDESGGVREVEE